MTIAQKLLKQNKDLRDEVDSGKPRTRDLNLLADVLFEDICEAEVHRKIFLDDFSTYTLTIPTSSQRFIELDTYENEHYREVYFSDDSYITIVHGMVLTGKQQIVMSQTEALTKALVKSENAMDEHVAFLLDDLDDFNVEECQDRAKEILNKGV